MKAKTAEKEPTLFVLRDGMPKVYSLDTTQEVYSAN